VVVVPTPLQKSDARLYEIIKKTNSKLDSMLERGIPRYTVLFTDSDPPLAVTTASELKTVPRRVDYGSSCNWYDAVYIDTWSKTCNTRIRQFLDQPDVQASFINYYKAHEVSINVKHGDPVITELSKELHWLSFYMSWPKDSLKVGNWQPYPLPPQASAPILAETGAVLSSN
jgi:hypothetical protein